MYKVSQNIDPNKIFIINRSELTGRFDPNPYHYERLNALKKLSESNNLLKLKDVVVDVKKITNTINGATYIGLENIESHTGDYIETKNKETISSAGVFCKGHILFPKLRPYLNKVHLASFDGVCSTEFHIYEVRENFCNEFVAIRHLHSRRRPGRRNHQAVRRRAWTSHTAGSH